jgi:hypothetical protein
MTIVLNFPQFTTESFDNILVFIILLKSGTVCELAISLLILVAHSGNTVLVLDHLQNAQGLRGRNFFSI